MDEIFRELSQPELQERLRRADLAYSSVNEVADIAGHPALRQIEVQSSKGPVSMPAPPVRSAGVLDSFGPPPEIDEQGAKIRQEFADSAS